MCLSLMVNETEPVNCLADMGGGGGGGERKQRRRGHLIHDREPQV